MRAAEEISAEVIEGDYQISHNIEECAKFIAVNLDRKEISENKLLDVIPMRKSFKGTKPTMLGPEMNMRPTMLLNDNIRRKFNMDRKNKRKRESSEEMEKPKKNTT